MPKEITFDVEITRINLDAMRDMMGFVMEAVDPQNSDELMVVACPNCATNLEFVNQPGPLEVRCTNCKAVAYKRPDSQAKSNMKYAVPGAVPKRIMPKASHPMAAGVKVPVKQKVHDDISTSGRSVGLDEKKWSDFLDIFNRD